MKLLRSTIRLHEKYEKKKETYGAFFSVRAPADNRAAWAGATMTIWRQARAGFNLF